MASADTSKLAREIVVSMDSIKVYNLTVGEVIQLERDTTDKLLPRLILYEVTCISAVRMVAASL